LLNKYTGKNVGNCNGTYKLLSGKSINKRPVWSCVAKLKIIFANGDGTYIIANSSLLDKYVS
jgi:hypothetical protein